MTGRNFAEPPSTEVEMLIATSGWWIGSIIFFIVWVLIAFWPARVARTTVRRTKRAGHRVEVAPRVPTKEERVVLATAKIEDFDRFWNTFSTKGAEKRKQHGCKGSHVFQDPNESDRVWVIFDWDEAGWQSFTSDPEVPAIFQEAGFTQGPPKSAEFLRQHDA